ncbi:MAG: prepilin peptidase [Vibrionaceae bacterium]
MHSLIAENYVFVVAILSLTIGSFLNVVIYRLPKMLEKQWQAECHSAYPDQIAAPSQETFNLSLPRSHCPVCKNDVAATDNIPVISWLLLGRKCRHCKTPISARYPLVELLTATLGSICALTLPYSPWSVAVIIATYFLIALSFIDFDTMLLPDDLTLSLMWGGILLALVGVSPVSLSDAVIGAMAGYLALWSVYQLFKLLTGKEGMGYGDFKLLAALGALLGWQILPLVIIIASVTGVIGGIISLSINRQGQSCPFPFGPYLAIAGWISLLWGQEIVNWYLNYFV